MYKKLTSAVTASLLIMASSNVGSEEVPITGDVSSKCVIHTDTAGVYANPTADVLTTAAADGGVPPVIRYDVVNANSYKAVITTPIDFSSSPALNDTTTWTGSSSVSRVTDPGMSAYDTNKRTYNNVTEFDLTVAGTVWFASESRVEYGYGKSLPGGRYKSIVIAECIAL
jgi:hypothetical protein